MDDRRDYFRIDEDFRVRVLPEGQEVDADREAKERIERVRRLGVLTARLAVRMPEIAEALELIRAEIDELRAAMPQDAPQPGAASVTGLNISASGAAFPARDPLPADTVVVLELRFSDGLRIVTRAQVVMCEIDEHGGTLRYVVRVRFIELHDDDRELLIGHLLRAQRAMIRADREEGESRTATPAS